MNRDIRQVYISESCRQCCVKAHQIGKDHKIMEYPKFKNRLNQFLSQGNQYWLQAYEKLQQLQKAFGNFRESMKDQILEKSLMYLLNYDKEGNLFKIFQLVRNDQIEMISCHEAAKISNRFDRKPNTDPAAIRAIINEIMTQNAQTLTQIISNILKSTSAPVVERYNSKTSQRATKSNVQIKPVGEKVIDRSQVVSRKQINVKFQNQYPTLKINEIQLVDSHFNIIAKVLSINKQFTLGESNYKKYIITAGDDSGTALFVIDAAKWIQEGTIFSIAKAKVNVHHGVKQIKQANKGSKIKKIENADIKVNHSYQFSKRKNQNFKKRQRQQRQVNQNIQNQKTRPQLNKNRNVQKFLDSNTSEKKVDIQKLKINPINIKNNQKRQMRSRITKQQNQSVQLMNIADQNISNRGLNMKNMQNKDYSYRNQQDNIEEQEQYISQKPAKVSKLSQQPKIQITKIKDLEPGMEQINLIAQIIQIDSQRPVKKNCIFCIIGDQTGTIWAQLPNDCSLVKSNVVITMKSVDTDVHSQYYRLLITMAENSLLQRSNINSLNIMIDVNMSQAEWKEDSADQNLSQNQSLQTSEIKKAIVEDF